MGKPYNDKCDVYSFTILFWEILALRQPFSEIEGEENFVHSVIKRGSRPSIKSSWPSSLKNILEAGWSEDINSRINMAGIKQLVRTELLLLRSGDETGLDHERRRSTFVFDKEQHAASIRAGDIFNDSFRSLTHAVPNQTDADTSPSSLNESGNISAGHW